MKMTTDIPANVITPDRMKTRLGTLEFLRRLPHRRKRRRRSGISSTFSAPWKYDYDHAGGLAPRLPQGIREWGPDNETMIFGKAAWTPRCCS